MSDLDPKKAEAAFEDGDSTSYGEGLELAVVNALENNDDGRVQALVDDLHAADMADLIEHLDRDDRAALVNIVKDGFDPDVLAELDDHVLETVVEGFSNEEIAGVVSGMDSDDAVRVVEELDEIDQLEVLRAIPAEERTLIEEALTYPEDSAGRLMERDVVSVPGFWNVGQAIDYLRSEIDLPEKFYDIFVVDPRHRLAGVIPLSQLLRRGRDVLLADIMLPNAKQIPVTTDQEDVAFLFRQRDLVSAPVVSDDGRLLGAITVDDVVDIIDEEYEEDLMRLGGVGEGDDLYSSAVNTTKTRFIWLLVNLGTAIIASVVISFFDATIEQIVALAVLMPIVASMGGNAGTQTLTVAVRALAMKEVSATNAARVIGKEVIVGGFNGVLFAALTGAVTWLWFGSLPLATVIAAAMVINMIVAGLAGAAIPLALEKASVDPAVASSVFLTTITDVVGFFAFLGLAALFLL